MHIYYAATHIQKLPDGHRFPMGKYELLRERLATELPNLTLNLAGPATDGQLALAHTPTYIEAVTSDDDDVKLCLSSSTDI